MNLQDLQDEIVCDFLVTADRKKVFAVYLDLLRVFEELCKKNHITWWICYGTLLGAIRHQGFIPWDDDVDIMIPRRDFDRLAAMSNSDFGAEEPYFLQSRRTDPTFPQNLLRFRRSDTTAIQDYDLTFLNLNLGKKPYNMGLNLSIFPLDDCPDGRLSYAVRKKAAYLIMGIDYRANQPRTEKPFLHMICRGVYRVLGPEFFINGEHFFFRVHNPDSTMVNSLDGFFPIAHYWKRSDYRETVWLPFENTKLPAPVGDGQLLGYGTDYMELPPVEKRVSAHDVYLNAEQSYKEVLSNPIFFADCKDFFTRAGD